MKKNTKQPQVLIFQESAKQENYAKRLLFLFSVTQVENILLNIKIHPIPFSPFHVEGLCLWKNSPVPVLSLEKALGLHACFTPEQKNSQGDSAFLNDGHERYIVVRTGKIRDKRRPGHAVFPAAGGLQVLGLPANTKPLPPGNRIPGKNLVRGLFEAKTCIYIVVDIDKMLIPNPLP